MEKKSNLKLISYPVEVFLGDVKIPADKSISHRALIIGGIALGQTKITNLLSSDDVRQKSTMASGPVRSIAGRS